MDTTWTERTFPLPDAGRLRAYPSRPLVRLWFDVGLALLAAVWAGPKAWRVRVRERRELRELDARMLRDVGLTDNEVDRELRKSFWKAFWEG